jgi:cytoskeletal protein CcmA (bactofilin family)
MAWFDRNPGGKKAPEAEPPKAPEAPKSPVEEPAPVAAAPEPNPTPAPAPKVEPRPAPSTAGLIGYLYKGSRISGQLSFQGPARIDGTVEGEISCQGTLTIGDSAEVKAKITGQVVVIHGKVEGNVTAKERIELVAPARLIGNMSAPRLVITEGVVFDGDCSMGVAKPKAGAAKAQAVNSDRSAAAQAPKLQADSQS